MARLRKLLLPNEVSAISFRVQEGLPLACLEFVAAMLWSCLARAQFLHPVKVCAFVIMGNHVHFLILVENPKDVVDFIERFKTESAHAINRMLGRRQRSVWCKGYDSPLLLTKNDVIKKLVYLYTNPQKADLVDRIEQYPGVSSWSMIQSGMHQRKAKLIPRTAFCLITKGQITLRREREITEALLAKSTIEHTFTLSPDAWMKRFKLEDSPTEVNLDIVRLVRETEDELRAAREIDGRIVVGAAMLQAQSIHKPYTPKKFSKRSWCICEDIALRKTFIRFAKSLSQKAEAVFNRWKTGDLTAHFPIGLFPPPLPRVANLIPPYFTH